MPYGIRKKPGGKWEVFNKNTGKGMGETDSEEMAMRQRRAILMSEHGIQPTRKK